MWTRLRASNVCRLGGCVFQSWIRRTAAERCLFPAAHRTRPSSTAPSAHPTASAHPQRPSHPAPLLGPPQTTAQRRKTPLTPSLQEADQASDWSLLFLAAMLKWGGREIPGALRSVLFELFSIQHIFTKSCEYSSRGGHLKGYADIVLIVLWFFHLWWSIYWGSRRNGSRQSKCVRIHSERKQTYRSTIRGLKMEELVTL